MASTTWSEDLKSLLDAMDVWARQRGWRLVREAPLTREEVDALPRILTGYPYALPTPYVEEAFVVPDSYRAFLMLHREVRLEHQPDDETWETYRPLHVWAPTMDSLTSAWTPTGTTVDDREITTTDLIAFADAYMGIEASRWCFYTRTAPKDGELPVYFEDNDYEALAGHYVDDGEWLDSNDPMMFGFESFEHWFKKLCTVLRREDLDLEDLTAVGNAMQE
ncbi:hypothetical protein [Corallococcus macrosporus]|uniref:Knr4/Smi1-like domain-containing protein n=1 Tax=Corallococcus macrosporus DSM 14697 TaxID=1189310 RepID=A0A250K1L2_9BACT|nr:hypothetical protein [Corallococcus macrosporus]ATB49602.1 hypothetical protein MYMAC_005256 [Corallococcus macrosporus DSM 14697]